MAVRSREECIGEAAEFAAEAFAILYQWPIEAAAERCRRPHESLADARRRIRARRQMAKAA